MVDSCFVSMFKDKNRNESENKNLFNVDLINTLS